MDFQRFSFTSAVDGKEDWYLFHKGERPILVVQLHGHGSHGDQVLRRPDVATRQVILERLKVYTVAPNLRDNAWMSEAAVQDLTYIINELKAQYGFKKVVIDAGSMGGTGALIYAISRPDMVDGIVALGASTCLKKYAEWCSTQTSRPIIIEIRDAILASYPTQEAMDAHDVCLHCDALTMPVFYYHGAEDQTIPASEAYALGEKMAGKPNFHMYMVPNGNHDSPLPFFCEGLIELLKVLGESIPEEAFKTVRVLFKQRVVSGRLEEKYGLIGKPRVFHTENGALDVPIAGPNVGLGSRQTVVTVLADVCQFSFFLRDVNSDTPICIPEYGVAVVPENDPRSYDEVARDIAARHLVSDAARMESEPEESYENACKFDRSKESPIWLGLGGDVRMFAFGEQSTMMGSFNYDYKFFGRIRPRLHTNIRRAIDEQPNSFYDLSFYIGPGENCRPHITKRLDEGVLPIYHATQDDQSIQYHVTAFATLEDAPLAAGRRVPGTEWHVAYAYTGINMLTQEQKDALAPQMKAETGEEREQVVCLIRVEAENVSGAPAYAWMKALFPRYIEGGGPIGTCGWENGMTLLNGKVAGVNLLNGSPMPEEEMAVLVQPGQKMVFEMRIPHCPLPAERAAKLFQLDYNAHLDGCRAYWLGKLEQGAAVSVPEAAVDERIHAGLCHLDIMTAGRPSEGPLLPTIGCYSPIGTESAPIIQYFDTMGWHKQAERCIAFFLERQREDGFIQNFNNYQSETGPLLWTAAEHFRYTQDTEWLARVTPKLIKAADYLLAWRERNKKEEYRERGYYGMIEGKVADPDEFFHSFFLNAGTYAGLAGMAECLVHTAPEYAEKLVPEVKAYGQDIVNGLHHAMAHATVMPLADGTWGTLPAAWVEYIGPSTLFADPGKWFTWHGSFASRSSLCGPLYFALTDLLDPKGPELSMLAKTNQHPITRENAAISQPYYSRHDILHIKRGEVKLFLKTFYNQFTALQDRQIYSFWEHYHGASQYKTHEEGWFLMQTRWMLYLEDGNCLDLFKAIPRKWLQAGKRITLTNVTTYFGKLNAEAVAEADTITCTFAVERPLDAVRIRLPHPDGIKAIFCSNGDYDSETETVTIKANSGRVTLKF